MEFKYRKLLVTLEWAIIVLSAFGVNWVLFGNNVREFYKTSMFIIALFSSFYAVSSVEQCGRTVVLSDEYAAFKSFRYKKMKKTAYVGVAYEDIIGLRAVRLPVFGTCELIVKTKNFKHEIILTWFFSDFQTLCEELTKRTYAGNPDAEIDKRLIKKYITEE